MKKPQRPVKCKLCGKQLYYLGDSRHRKEVSGDLYDRGHYREQFVAHLKCWRKLFK